MIFLATSYMFVGMGIAWWAWQFALHSEGDQHFKKLDALAIFLLSLVVLGWPLFLVQFLRGH